MFCRSAAPYVENIGNGKGLELIPFDNVEVILGVPPYLVRHSATISDGFGDWRALLKYRLLSANEEAGNYLVTAFLDVSLPTSSTANGQPNAIVTPMLGYGKGFGRFDVQGTIGVALPLGNAPLIGRTYTWNNAFQYQVFRRLWPEVEVNATFFQDGQNSGHHQIFITPALLIGRLALNRRVGLTVGAGVQIAVSEFRTSTHNVIVTARLPF